MILCVLLCFILVGCGHNGIMTTKGIGIQMCWNGGSYIPNINVGYWDMTGAIIRGNASYTSNNITGGTLLSGGGVSQTTQLTVGTQVNEGNIEKIMNSPNVPDEAKVVLAGEIYAHPAPDVKDTYTKTLSAAATTGSSSIEAKPVTTGFDKVVETAGDVINSGVTKTVDKAEKAYYKTYMTARNIIIASIAILVIFLLIIIRLIIYFSNRKYEEERIMPLSDYT